MLLPSSLGKKKRKEQDKKGEYHNVRIGGGREETSGLKHTIKIPNLLYLLRQKKI